MENKQIVCRKKQQHNVEFYFFIEYDMELKHAFFNTRFDWYSWLQRGGGGGLHTAMEGGI